MKRILISMLTAVAIASCINSTFAAQCFYYCVQHKASLALLPPVVGEPAKVKCYVFAPDDEQKWYEYFVYTSITGFPDMDDDAGVINRNIMPKDACTEVCQSAAYPREATYVFDPYNAEGPTSIPNYHCYEDE